MTYDYDEIYQRNFEKGFRLGYEEARVHVINIYIGRLIEAGMLEDHPIREPSGEQIQEAQVMKHCLRDVYGDSRSA